MYLFQKTLIETRKSKQLSKSVIASKLSFSEDLISSIENDSISNIKIPYKAVCHYIKNYCNLLDFPESTSNTMLKEIDYLYAKHLKKTNLSMFDYLNKLLIILIFGFIVFLAYESYQDAVNKASEETTQTLTLKHLTPISNNVVNSHNEKISIQEIKQMQNNDSLNEKINNKVEGETKPEIKIDTSKIEENIPHIKLEEKKIPNMNEESIPKVEKSNNINENKNIIDKPSVIDNKDVKKEEKSTEIKIEENNKVNENNKIVNNSESTNTKNNINLDNSIDKNKENITKPINSIEPVKTEVVKTEKDNNNETSNNESSNNDDGIDLSELMKASQKSAQLNN